MAKMRAKTQKTLMRNIILFHAMLLGFLIFITSTTHAAQSEWAVSDNVRARLLSGVKSVGDETTIQAALEVDMEEGWHTYWKHAGDSGLPMRFNWDGSTNLTDVKISYPVPLRKRELDILTVFAYDDRIILPMEVTLESAQQDTNLELELQLMVCKEICVPDQLKVSLDLSKGEGEEAHQLKIIEAAKRKVPYVQGEGKKDSDLFIDTIVTGKEAIVVSAHMKRGSDKALLIAHNNDFAFTTKPVFAVDEADPQRVMITVPKPEDVDNLMDVLNGQTLTIVLSDGRQAVEKSIDF